MLCVAILTVENADSALISSSVVGRADIWLRNAHRTGVRLEVILSLGLIQTVQKKSADVVTGMLHVFSTFVYALFD